MKSTRSVLVVVMLLFAALLSVGVSTAQAAEPNPTVKVSPSRNLVDGQRVWVAGSGLPAHESINVILCDHLETNNIDEGCFSDKTVTSDGKGRVLTRLTLDAVVNYGGPVGPGFPIFCRADRCRVILAWGDPNIGEQQSVESRELQFRGSPATIEVTPSTDLRRKQWVTVTGTAFGAERHVVGVRQLICSTYADAFCYGDQPYVWTRVRNDGTYRATYLVRRFVPTAIDSPSPTRHTDCVYLEKILDLGTCQMTAVILDRNGKPDDTFGLAELFGEPAGLLHFAY